MTIVSLIGCDELARAAAAQILVEALAHVPSAWPDLDSARVEVEACLSEGRVAFGAVTQDGRLLGWVGAIPHTTHLWELHPLAVRPEAQRRGIGRSLVNALENEASRQGVSTIWLGVDDDFGGTNLYGVDLYPNPLEKLAEISAEKGHPFVFYQEVGFSIVGVIPDATGYGRPDILMAKRVRPQKD